MGIHFRIFKYFTQTAFQFTVIECIEGFRDQVGIYLNIMVTGSCLYTVSIITK